MPYLPWYGAHGIKAILLYFSLSGYRYEGRSINKLQNDIILLIFKIWTFGNIRFVGNLIGDIYWNFYDDDVITVTSLVLRTQSVSAVAQQFLPRDAMHKRGYSRHAVSVCPSVTFVSCVKTNKHIFEIFSRSGSQAILVFFTPNGVAIFRREPP